MFFNQWKVNQSVLHQYHGILLTIRRNDSPNLLRQPLHDVCKSNHYSAHLTYTVLYVKYISIKLEEKKEEMNYWYAEWKSQSTRLHTAWFHLRITFLKRQNFRNERHSSCCHRSKKNTRALLFLTASESMIISINKISIKKLHFSRLSCS